MKRLVLGILLVSLLVGTVACASKSEAPPTLAPVINSGQGRVPPTTYTMAPPAVEQQKSAFGLGSRGSSDAAVPAPVIAVPAPATAVPAQGSSSSGYQAATTERMIIRNGAMQLVVTDIAEAIKQITKLAGDYGGFVVNSNIQESQSRLYGNISIRVLSDRFNDALAALRALAEDVKSESTSGQDVTEEYTDLDAKLRNLQAAEAQLLKLMEQAGKVTEILEVQKELVNTRGQIEQVKGRMQYLEQSSSLAFIQVTLEQSKLAIEFNATGRTIKEGAKIYFVPTISGGFQPYSYEWDFGDGQTSTEGAPQHAYKKDGTYDVSLKVTDDHANTTSLKRDKYITVLSGWEAGNTASSAWNGFVGFMHFLVDLLTWIGIFSPVWLIILVVLYFAWWRRRKKAR